MQSSKSRPLLVWSYCRSIHTISFPVVLVVGPKRSHLFEHGEPGAVRRACTAENGLHSAMVARITASVFGVRRPKSQSRVMMDDGGQESDSLCFPSATTKSKARSERRASRAGGHSFKNRQLGREAQGENQLRREESFFLSLPARSQLLRSSSGERSSWRSRRRQGSSMQCELLSAGSPVYLSNQAHSAWCYLPGA